MILDSLGFTKGAVVYCVDSVSDFVKSAKYIADHFEAKTIPDRMVKNLFYVISDTAGILAESHFSDTNSLMAIIADVLDRTVLYKPKSI